MKLINKITLGMLALAGLASCEMREEIWGKAPVTETGVMTVAVDAQAPVATKAPIITANFLLKIFNEEGEIEHSFSKVSDFPAAGVTLPVGDYRVAAYSQDPTTVEKRMDNPYYKGSEIATIVAGVTKTNVVVDCKMQNTRIVVEPDATFGAMFSEWTMTLDDGSETALVFRHTDSNWDAYWLFPEGVETLIGNITGKTVTGNSIAQTFSVSKSSATEKEEGDDSDYFEGGEKLVISLKHTTATEGNVNGITVNATITFTNTDTEVDIPVHWEKDEPSTEPDEPETPDVPETPGTEDDNVAIQITEPSGNSYLVNGVTYPMADGSIPNVVINMAFEKGLKNMYVLASSTHEAFGDLLGMMGGLTTSPGLDLTSQDAIDASLGELFDLPKVGDPTYNFALKKELLELMLEQGCPGVHSFQLTAVDTEGNSVTKTLKVTIVDTKN